MSSRILITALLAWATAVAALAARDDDKEARGAPAISLRHAAHPADGLSTVQDIQVAFRDDVIVPIRLHRIAIVHPPYQPTDRLVDQYDALARVATEGNAPAARMLHRALLGCRRLLDWEAKHSGKAQSERQPDDPIKYCDGLSKEQLDEAPAWAQLSAENGDYLGREDWAAVLRRSGRIQESLEVGQALWRDGYYSSLALLTILYQMETPTPNKPDYVLAYAHHFALLKLMEAIHDPTSPARRSHLIAMEQHRQWLGGKLSPQQQQRAEQLAVELLSGSPTCCIGLR